MNIIFVLIYVLISNTHLWAEDWSAIYRAKSSEELMQVDREQHEKGLVKEKCEYEQFQSQFPKNCYLYMESLLEVPMSIKGLNHLKKSLNKLCENNVEQLTTVREAHHFKNHPLSNDKCREQISVRIADIKYAEDQSN